MCQHLRIRTARNRYSNHWPLLVTFRLLLSRVKTEGFQSVCLTALKEVLWSRKYEKRHKPYNIGEKKSYFPLGWLHLNILNTAHNKETLSVNIQLAR